MKKIFLNLFFILILNNFSFAEEKSQGYEQVKSLVSIVDEIQSVSAFYAHIINATRGHVEQECANSSGIDCIVTIELPFLVTQEMKDNDIYDALPSVGSIYKIPSNAITFTDMSENNSSNFDYKVAINLQILQDEDGSETFQWNKNDKTIGLNFKDNDSDVTMVLKNNDGNKSLSGNMKFTDFDGTTTLNLEISQYDNQSNGIEIVLNGIESNGNSFNINAKADDSGGYISSSITDTVSGTLKERETFDKNKNRTGYEVYDDTSGWLNDGSPLPTNNEYIFDDITYESTVTVHLEENLSVPEKSIFYVVVKKGEQPTGLNEIGFGNFYDSNEDGNISVQELYFDYFGFITLLAEQNSTTDTDNLDIYEINSDVKEVEYKLVSGIWLSSKDENID
jgi:hypothetical protein